MAEDDKDGIPWCWKYVALVIINPWIGGLCNLFVWGPLSLHWADNSWPAWRLGLLSMIVHQLRTPAVQLLVSTGLWMTLVFVFVSFLVMLPSIFAPQEEWAVAVLVMCEAFETYVLYDSVSFVSFAETEQIAQQASGHTLRSFTLAAALAPTIGGFIYLLFGWQGIAFLGAGAKLVQLLVLAMDKTVQGQVVQIMSCLFRPRVDYDSDDVLDEDFEAPEPAERSAKSPGQSDSEEAAAEVQMPPVFPPPALPPAALPPPALPAALPGIPEDSRRFKTEVAFETDMPEEGAVGPRASRKSRRSRADSSWKRGSEIDPDSPVTRGSQASRTTWISAMRTSTRKSRMSQMSQQSLRSITSMTQATFNSYALAQVDAPGSSLAQRLSTLAPDESDELDEPGGSTPVRIPGYMMLPLLAIVSVSFAGQFALSMSTLVVSVVFQELFGLNAAISGAIRSAGGVMAVLGMALAPAVASDEEIFARNKAWKLLATVLCKPYKLSAIVALWCVLSLGLATPNIYLAAPAHFCMGIALALTNRAVSDMCLFFSLGDGGVFLKMQVLRSFSDAFGGGLACLLGPIIYESFGAQGPFLVGAAMSFVVFVFYITTFCIRVGMGKSLEDTEAARALRRGIVRKNLWKTKSEATIPEEPEEE